MALSSIFSPTFIGDLTFQKFRDQARHVVLATWIDHVSDVKYQELFAIANATPGPGSTKMLFNIIVIRGGFLSGILAFLMWSLPGAIGMFAFSLGVERIGDSLPAAVYALLSGLNAATVGIIALAAVQLSQKVITDKLTRALVFLGAASGMLYTALWYFPVLMVAAGVVSTAWDLKVMQKLARSLHPRKGQSMSAAELEESRGRTETSNASRRSIDPATTGSQHNGASTTGSSHLHQIRQSGARSTTPSMQEVTSTSNPSFAVPNPPESNRPILTWRGGLLLLVVFFASFLTIMLIRGLYKTPARVFSLFANMYLAGTIIFGGGPVVIPLLREYVVAEGWVSPRNFLLGLALIQAFPGPNFNFAVYLGALAVAGTSTPSVLGAIVAYLGIFVPGLTVQSGIMGIWGSLPKSRALLSALRGVNAAAVGLVFTAVYRLWQIGFLDQDNQDGQPLGGSPWWVVVTATSFVGQAWFGLNPPSAVVLGGVMGMPSFLDIPTCQSTEMALWLMMDPSSISQEPGGFLQPTLPSPPQSSVNSPPPPRSLLPSPRSKPLRPGSSKEGDLISYIEQKLLAVSRRYENRISAALSGEENPDVEGRGYKDIGEQLRELDPVVDVVWISGTPSLQITFLLTIALSVTSALESFPFTPRPTFQFLRKMDLAFSSLLKGVSAETGESLPGFQGGRGRLSMTEKVRMSGIVERTRVAVVEVAGKDGSLADVKHVPLSETDTEEDFNVTEDDDVDMLEDESSHRRWEMDIARVYEKTIVELGMALDASVSSIDGWLP
ncbi:MAG: hypothetical protein Q9173_005690 [Seirophora scorigena]